MGRTTNMSASAAPSQAPHAIVEEFDSILILDFGSQYSHLITRRCRELKVYCEMLPCTTKLADVKWRPKGIILSGSPYSVYDAQDAVRGSRRQPHGRRCVR